jgi:hypothetical protein
MVCGGSCAVRICALAAVSNISSTSAGGNAGLDTNGCVSHAQAMELLPLGCSGHHRNNLAVEDATRLAAVS